MPKKVVLIVIDGLTPSVFEQAVGDRRAPALSYLAEHGSYARAVSTFPSLTPVCLSSIATGGGPDVHHIPHLVWLHRSEERLVEYGSSFAAIRAAGFSRSVLDTIFNMNARHLSQDAVTVYESLEDSGLVAGAINITCYRGRTKHLPTLPWLTKAAFGPKRFFFYSLFESDPTGAPLAVRNRAGGSIDEYAAWVGRWLVTRDGFDFLAYYLSDYDYASHLHGPEGAGEQLAVSDRSVARLMDAAGGPDEFLERYAVVLCSDHGQTSVREPAFLNDAFLDLGTVLPTASNRAGMVYRLEGCGLDARELAGRLDGEPWSDVALFRDEADAIARHQGEELRFRPADGGWETTGDESLLTRHPNGLERAWSALANPNAGELIVSPSAGWEFADLAGRHHAGGGSHGSLLAGDSEVPMLTVGLESAPARIVGVVPLVLRHFGVPHAV